MWFQISWLWNDLFFFFVVRRDRFFLINSCWTMYMDSSIIIDKIDNIFDVKPQFFNGALASVCFLNPVFWFIRIWINGNHFNCRKTAISFFSSANGSLLNLEGLDYQFITCFFFWLLSIKKCFRLFTIWIRILFKAS